MFNPIKKNNGVIREAERSFTLIETLIALSLMVFLVIEVGGVQVNAIYFSRYGRNVTQAVWLAKRLMAQVEYQWTIRPFKELETANEKDRPFEDFPEYSYTLEIKDWKLPILDLITGGAGGGEGDDKKEDKKDDNDPIKSAMQNVFGDSILKTAHVEVSWAEGARRNNVGLTYLLTNQEKLDELLTTLKGIAEPGGVPPGSLPGATPGGGSPGGGVPGGTTGGQGPTGGQSTTGGQGTSGGQNPTTGPGTTAGPGL